MNRTTVLMAFVLWTLILQQQTTDRNQIKGTIFGTTGTTDFPLADIRVYLWDLSNQEKNFTQTDGHGQFSIIAPVGMPSFRLVFDDAADQYWGMKEEFENTTHPHDIGTKVLHSVKQHLTASEAREQVQIANVLRRIRRPEGDLLLSRVATEYPESLESRGPHVRGCGVLSSGRFEAEVIPVGQVDLAELLRQRITHNEVAARTAMVTINAAQHAYSRTYSQIGYADSLAKLGPDPDHGEPTSEHANLIDAEMASGKVPGYSLELTAGSREDASLRLASLGRSSQGKISTYEVIACPTLMSLTGRYLLSSDQSGEIRKSGPLAKHY